MKGYRIFTRPAPWSAFFYRQGHDHTSKLHTKQCGVHETPLVTHSSVLLVISWDASSYFLDSLIHTNYFLTSPPPPLRHGCVREALARECPVEGRTRHIQGWPLAGTPANGQQRRQHPPDHLQHRLQQGVWKIGGGLLQHLMHFRKLISQSDNSIALSGHPSVPLSSNIQW